MTPPTLLVLLWSGLAAAQVRFSGKEKITPAIGTVKSTPHHNSSQGHHDFHFKSSTFTKPEQTRFAPDVLESLDLLGGFSDKACQQCSIADQELAHMCCQFRRTCCSLILPAGPIGAFGPGVQTFPGQFAGPFPKQFPGQVPEQFPGPFPGPLRLPGPLPSQIPNHAGPPELTGALGGKVGACPLEAGIHTGFNRFRGEACVAECNGDLDCPGLLKCCPVACSTVCHIPQGVIHPATKPGLCPRQGLTGVPGLHLGVPGFSLAIKTPTNISPETKARILEQQDDKERHLSRKERRQERTRKRRSLSEEEQITHYDNFLKQILSRVTRSFHRPEQDDHRERLRNRWERTRGRVHRSTEIDHQDDRMDQTQLDGARSVESDEADIIIRRVARQAVPDQRVFLGDPFCRDECFNDFDCPANLKCCFLGKTCRQCFSPTFP